MPRSVLRLLQSNPTVQIEGEFENEFEIANDAPLVGYVMNADGTSQMRLTNNPAQDVRPDWQRVAAPSATPVPSPPASPTPTAFPPSVSRIPDQTLAQDNAVTVPFTITGAVIACVARAPARIRWRSPFSRSPSSPPPTVIRTCTEP